MKIQELSKIPLEQRDMDWEARFLEQLVNSKLRILSPDPQMGPDSWPYLMVSTEDSDQNTEPTAKVVEWLSTRGIGMVINPEGEYPDYVLTYGMIWNFKQRQRFLSPVDRPSSPRQMGSGSLQIVHAGTPTEEYLPQFVRKILKEFFRDQGVHGPRILVLSEDRKHYDLAFSAESLGSPPEKEWSGIAEAISWFLPAHYSILITSEKNLPQFSDLAG
ncbi:MAG: hypothetical protein WCH11_05490 [Bdellovibrio sp.]